MIRPVVIALSSILTVLCAPAALAVNFTTAAEVKPILQATQATWVAVRTFNGQDLLYFTQIESWRCGLRELSYEVNGDGQRRTKEMEPCYDDTPAPNAFRLDSHLPYVTFAPDSVTNVSVTLTFEDGSTLSAQFPRNQIELR